MYVNREDGWWLHIAAQDGFQAIGNKIRAEDGIGFPGIGEEDNFLSV
jgi:hypothetical protein